MTEFEGLGAIITGGASGIGLATARLLRSRGAAVAILDREIPDVIAAEFPTAIKADVTVDDQVRAAVAAAAEALPSIDICINNAGIGSIGNIEANDDAEWFHVFDVNVMGLVRTSRAAYSASKGAIYSLTLAMATDHIRENIRVNCVNPGTADTPWIGRLLAAADDPAAERAALEARQPMGRLVSAEEVAAGIAYLASPLAASVTGTALAIDGGMAGLRLRPRS